MFLRQLQRRKHGFTLIELLVVIVIILVLAAVLFPVFLQAREKARQVTCVSNLRQLGLAINTYVADNDGFLPSVGNIWTLGSAFYDPDKYRNLFPLIEPYTKSIAIFSCNTEPDRRVKPGWEYDPASPHYDGGKWKQCNYTTTLYHWRLNATDSNAGSSQFRNKFAEMAFREYGSPEPENFYSFKYSRLDGGGEKADSSNTIILACIASSWFLPSPTYAPTFRVPGHHLEDGIALFADGHVKRLNWRWFGWF